MTDLRTGVVNNQDLLSNLEFVHQVLGAVVEQNKYWIVRIE